MTHPSPSQGLQRLRSHWLASVWTIPAVILPLVAATLAWFAYDEREQTLEQEYRFLEAHARIAEGRMAGLLRNIEQLLTRVAEERPSVPAGKLAAYEAALAERMAHFPELRVLIVTDAEGRIRLAANPELKGFDASAREYFTAHRARAARHEMFTSRPFKTSHGDINAGFSMPILGPNGEFLGVAVAGITLAHFAEVLTEIKPAGRSVAAVVNTQGDILYRLPDPEKYAGASIARSAPFQAFMHSDKPMSRTIGKATIDGVERIYVHRKIANSNLGIAVARPLDDVLADWRGHLAMRALVFAAAAALTIGLAAIAHRRHREMLAGKAFAEQLIETASIMLVGLDTQGRVTIFNEAAERVTGYRRDEVLGHDWFVLAVPRERYPQVWEAFSTCLATGKIPRSFENPILTKAGEERLIAWQNSEVRQDGALAATISFGLDITEQRKIEEIRRNEEVSRRLVALQEEERRRLAIELHDRTSPNLSALRLNLNSLTAALSEEAADKLAALQEDTAALLADTIESIRDVSTDFRPPLLDYAGLGSALEGYARHLGRRTGIQVRVANMGATSRLSPDLETNLFRIAQEALINCAKHSRAKSVNVTLAQGGDAVELAVCDDGIGFDPAAVVPAGYASGYGLTAMRKRAEFIGANFRLEKGLDGGMCIRVSVARPSAGDAPAAAGLTET